MVKCAQGRGLKSGRAPASRPSLLVKLHERRQHVLALRLSVDSREPNLELVLKRIQSAATARALRRTQRLEVTRPGMTLELCIGTDAGPGRFTGPPMLHQLIGQHRRRRRRPEMIEPHALRACGEPPRKRRGALIFAPPT